LEKEVDMDEQGKHAAEDVTDVTPDEAPEDLDNAETADANDQADVPAALQRDTDDGKGGAVVPASDFEGFAGEDVENEVDDDERDSV
jgi:hypothetical protein